VVFSRIRTDVCRLNTLCLVTPEPSESCDQTGFPRCSRLPVTINISSPSRASFSCRLDLWRSSNDTSLCAAISGLRDILAVAAIRQGKRNSSWLLSRNWRFSGISTASALTNPGVSINASTGRTWWSIPTPFGTAASPLRMSMRSSNPTSSEASRWSVYGLQTLA